MKELTTSFINISENVSKWIELFKKSFNNRLLDVPNEIKLFENEIERTLSQRFDDIPPYLASFDDDIPLREYFNMAWDSAENGLGEDIPKNIYLWGKVALSKIEEKYSGQKKSENYFERLNKVAREEYVLGAAYAWFHYWLKDEFEIFKNQGNDKKVKSPTNNVIALFCHTLNASGVLTIGPTEKQKEYCERVCQKFNLTYVDKVRQGYNSSNSRSNFNKIKELILPNIDQDVRDKITHFIDNKNKPGK